MQKITPFLWFDTQAEEAKRVMEAMLKMKKIDIAALKAAAEAAS
jgi:predicted 3-demethylubiquinone-9 3-methyltransferase (glyoxalase superfamily)